MICHAKKYGVIFNGDVQLRLLPSTSIEEFDAKSTLGPTQFDIQDDQTESVDVIDDITFSPNARLDQSSPLSLIEGFDVSDNRMSPVFETSPTTIFIPELERDPSASESSSIASQNIDLSTCPILEAPVYFEQHDIFDCDQNLNRRQDESSSITGTNYSSDDEVSRQTLMLRLRSFGNDAHVSRRHMNELINIFRNLGFSWLPLDYRTMLTQCASIEALTSISAPFAQPRDVWLTLVCGRCWLSTFSDDFVQAAVECDKCLVTTLQCPRHLCRVKCILLSSLCGRAVSSLIYCQYCGVGPETVIARRTFRFTLAGYLARAFADQHFVHSAMAPFRGFCDLKQEQLDKPCQLFCVPNWYTLWKSFVESRPYASEIWDGKLFRENSLWSAHGPRSLLLVISLDWFPPFKQQDYSVGVLTVSPANLTATERAKRINTWILAVIEGPNEPAHVMECLRPCFEEIRSIMDSGVEVFDVGTMSQIKVHVSAPIVSADVPACAKLGNLYGHSSYFPCVSCDYKGAVCGCKPRKNNAAAPARWNNRIRRGMVNSEHVLLSGDPLRTLNPGEHIAFVDTEALLPHHVRSEAVHVAGLRTISALLESETNQALIDRERKKARSNGPSVLTLLGPGHFTFTTGFAIEAMHTVIKGPLSRLWSLTVSDKYKKKWFNVQYYDNGLKILKHRLSKFKFPIGSPSASKFVNRRHSLKAEELYTILRVCGPIVFNNIVPKSVVQVWTLFTRLFTNLLHYHVSRTWMNASWGLRPLLKEAFEKYLAVFGPCSMPSNFHRILHCWLDFRNWGPLRSHWAFPYERLYGALSATSRMQNRSKVTMSIVNAIHLLYATGFDREVDSPGRILKVPPKFVDVEALEVSGLLNAGYVWVKTFNLVHSRRWHVNELLVSLSAGCSMSADCFFVIAGILCPSFNKSTFGIHDNLPETDWTGKTYFVLRQLTRLSTRRVFKDAAQFYTLPTVDIDNHISYGRQFVYCTTKLINSNNAICGVVRYTLDPHSTLLFPSFGLVEFN